MRPKNSLKNQIALLCVTLVAVCCLVLLLAFWLFTWENQRQHLTRSIVHTDNVFRQYLESREDVLATAAQVLTADFGFKQAVATRDADTIASALANHSARIGAELMWLLDINGNLISTSAGMDGEDGTAFDWLTSELIQAPGQGFFVVLDNVLYQVILLPVNAPRLIAYTLVGFEIDAAVTLELRELTGMEITFFDGRERLLSSSLPLAKNAPFISELNSRSLPGLFFPRAEFSSHQLELNAVSDRPVGVLISAGLGDFYRDLDRQLQTMLVLAGIILLIGLAASVLLARNLTVPLAKLVVAARRFALGQYDGASLHRQANDEIASLFNAFADMGKKIDQREQQVLFQARHDGLTGLHNRNALLELIDWMAKSGDSFVVFALNIRGFQFINNSLGPDMGDRCLRAIADRLAQRPGEHARIGGDEFVSLLPLAEGQNAATCCGELLDLLRQPVAVADLEIPLSFRAGACEFPADGGDGKTLLRRVTIALESVRNEGGDLRFYRTGEDEMLLQRLAIVEALRTAMQRDDGQLFMYYQPKLNLRTGQIDKVESLIRWRRPDHGWVSPEIFVSLAEQTGLIFDLSRWVLRTVVRQVCQWQREGIQMRAAINISAQDINHPDFCDFLKTILGEYGIAPAFITLELTERDLMSNELQAISVLKQLRDEGFGISVDDYGIGQSSLGKLKKLPVDELKIDKSFILKLDASPTDQMIVQSTINLGHNLGLVVVAEGVENEASLHLLRKMGADYIQGYFLAKPFAATELKPWLENYYAVSKHA